MTIEKGTWSSGDKTPEKRVHVIFSVGCSK